MVDLSSDLWRRLHPITRTLHHHGVAVGVPLSIKVGNVDVPKQGFKVFVRNIRPSFTTGGRKASSSTLVSGLRIQGVSIVVLLEVEAVSSLGGGEVAVFVGVLVVLLVSWSWLLPVSSTRSSNSLLSCVKLEFLRCTSLRSLRKDCKLLVLTLPSVSFSEEPPLWMSSVLRLLLFQPRLFCGWGAGAYYDYQWDQSFQSAPSMSSS